MPYDIPFIVRNDEVAGSTPVSSTIFSVTYFRYDVQLPKLPNWSR
jgi:hypothetical protein